MIIAFSFLSVLKDNYKDYINKFNSFSGDNWLHFDVMDGIFVENKTYDFNLIKEVNQYNNLYSDIHLMIDNPIDVIKEYVNAGANQITFHYEAIKDNVMDIIREINKFNIKVGISIKPNTKVDCIREYLPYLDYILVMSVEPGKGGQEFISSSLDKISYLKRLQSKYHYLIGVDGGINDINIRLVKEAGADVAIVGTYLANNLNKETIDKLMN